MKVKIALISMLVVWTVIARNLYGQEAVNIKRFTSPVEFDGVPEESAWSELEMFPMTMHRPDFGSEPSEVSDIRIGYDDLYLWVGASLYMNDVTKIFDATKKRDDRLFSFDAIGILLDTYNDNENGLAFFTTPSGLRTDYSISNDAAGGGGPMGSMMNFNWNTFWDVKTVRDEKGWYAEMRIPFSSLKFKPDGDIATMGVIITRNISANNETDSYPSIDPKFGFLATMKPSQAQTITIADAKPSKPVYITPYAIGGMGQEWVMNELETGYERINDPKLNAGLDVKYNINSNLTLDLTANTDFAQVEADDQQVNLTRYSLFFPEKRVFFQERSSLFDFSLGGRADNLFYSRNIGIADGEQIRIYGGARMTGRVGKWDLGFLDMQTAGKDTIPSENFGVLRMRRQVINPNTYVGGILTSRLGDDGHQNLAYGIDWIYRVFGNDYMNLKWAQAYDSDAGTRLNSLDPSFILADWERRTEEGIAYKVNYTYLGNSFDPGIGFVRRAGVQGLNGNLSYGWLPGKDSKLFSYNVTVRGEKYTRIVDNGLESQQISPGFELTTKNRIRAEVSLNFMKEGVTEDFSVAENITIPAGIYSFYNSEIRFSTTDARKLSIRSNLSLGQFYDGFRYGIQAEPNLNVSSSFRMSLSYQYNALRFPDRTEDSSADIHLVNLKAIYMFSTKLSASVMMQYANTENELVTNFRIRYNPREGNDFYIVYNGGRNTYRDLDDPRLPLYNSRALLLKYTYTFIL